jgi:hypothetical protein
MHYNNHIWVEFVDAYKPSKFQGGLVFMVGIFQAIQYGRDHGFCIGGTLCPSVIYFWARKLVIISSFISIQKIASIPYTLYDH